MKSAAPATLVEAATQIMMGRFFVSAAVSDLVIARLAVPAAGQADPTATLSDRELEVFLLIGAAFGTGDIACRLRVSVSSIESYRAGIKRKLNLTNCTQLVHAAVSCVMAANGAHRRDAQPAAPLEPLAGRTGAGLRRP
jgi:DNA-binding NarL/FixJ family response regulator